MDSRLDFPHPNLLLLLALLLLAAAACSQPAPTPTPTATPSPPALTPTTQSPGSTPTAELPLLADTPAPPTPTPAGTAESAPLLQSIDVEVAFPNLSFERMVFLTHAGDDTDRLFLVLQPGRIMVFPNQRDVSSAEVFLDIRDRVSDRGNEEGLLGLAFDPGFAESGYFYVYYSASNPRRSVLSRFSVDGEQANPASERVVLEVPQPYSNHNGGAIQFGADGYLYVALGDGGSSGDPKGNGQDPGTLLGSILRIDPAAASSYGNYSVPGDNPFLGVSGFRDEIWAFGFRNPWRFSFDRETGDLWAGDVGQRGYEEIDLVKPGLNYGWNVMEGFHCYPPSVSSCRQDGLEPPLAEYPLTSGNCAVTGGYVYRGSRVPLLQGAYLYGDFCSGRIWGLIYDGQEVSDTQLLLDSSLEISSFAEDEAGELYILSFDRKIYRLRQQG